MLSTIAIFSTILAHPTIDSFPIGINQVNRYVNSFTYRPDPEDQWQTLSEFLENGGDCEDFALAKLQMLVAQGMSPRRFRIALVRDRYRRPHAVLLYQSPDMVDSNALVLDSATDAVVSTSARGDLEPIVSFSETNIFLHSGSKWEISNQYPLYQSGGKWSILRQAFRAD